MKTIKKLYNRHMMVMVDEDDAGVETIVTGDALLNRLAGMNFTVPAIEEYVKVPLPNFDLNGDGVVSNYEIQQGLPIMREILAENERRLQAYFKQFKDYSVYLANETGLVFARLVQYKDGKKTWREWVTDVKIGYTYQQAAERLMGKGTDGVITANINGEWEIVTAPEFIAYQYFG